MRCAFLREAQVKYCCASAYKKMIVRTPEHASKERCSSPEWSQCPVAREHREEHPSQDHCPFLQESLVQYCSASPVSKFVPYTEAVLSRCGNDNHHYCELYVSLAEPPKSSREHATGLPGKTESWVDGIWVPMNVSYSRNHLWLDVNEDHTYHVGIDGFLARVLGKVDDINFLTNNNAELPTVVLTVRGVDLQLAFPNRMTVTATNSYLRSNPEKINTDPYKLGWLFEGVDPKMPKTGASKVEEGLISSKQACSWIAAESRRLTSYVHEMLAGRSVGQDIVTAMDGGTFVPGIARTLSHEEMLRLFNEFFSTAPKWRLTV